MARGPVLVAGATGYVGGRLVPRLLLEGWRVRAAGRSAEKLNCRPWSGHERLEMAVTNVLDPETTAAAAQGCEKAVYLVHSMRAGGDYAERDRRAARVFAEACAREGVRRIVYLGGLGDAGEELSEHLRSRLEVAEILGAGPVPMTFLRAGIIVGSGSASFELVRHLGERLPVVAAGQWARGKCAPIAISDVLSYLVGSLDREEMAGQAYGLCGPDVISYEDLLRIYRQEAGLPRLRIIHSRLLTPAVSSYLAHLFTPVPYAIARPLFEGLRNETLCFTNRIREIIPLRLMPVREAMRVALGQVAERQVESCWADAGAFTPPEWALCDDAPWAGGKLMELGYRVRILGTPEEAFRPIQRIGGETGWYFADFLWSLRGAMDKLAGGVGLSRGRRSERDLRVGDAVDFWRVIELEPAHRLTLLAEMKAPGEAVLQFEVEPRGPETEIRVRARFAPRGIKGILYWYGVHPLHGILFTGMMRELAEATGRPMVGKPELTTPFFPSACRMPERRSPAAPVASAGQDVAPPAPYPEERGHERSERREG